MPIRITGLTSGLDTEAIISALVSSYNYKTNKYKKAQTKLSWKQDAWKTLNTKIYSLYTSVGNMKLSTAYNLKSTTVSDSTKATVKAGNNAPTGTQQLNIIKVAQAGYLTGAQSYSAHAKFVTYMLKCRGRLADIKHGNTKWQQKLKIKRSKNV